MAKRRNLLYALLAVCLVTSMASVPFLSPSMSIAGTEEPAPARIAPQSPADKKIAALYNHELKRALGPLAPGGHEMGGIADEAAGGKGSGAGGRGDAPFRNGAQAGVGGIGGSASGGGSGVGSGGLSGPGLSGSGLAGPGFGSIGGGGGPGAGNPQQGGGEQAGPEEGKKAEEGEEDPKDEPTPPGQQPTPFDPLDPIVDGPGGDLTPEPDRTPELSPPSFQPDPLPPEFTDTDKTLPPPPVAVSEPSTLILLLAGGIGLAVARRIQRR